MLPVGSRAQIDMADTCPLSLVTGESDEGKGNGMEEHELIDLCQSRARVPFRFMPSPYWTAEVYGFGKYIREYGYYPFFLPLCVYTDHGPGDERPYKHALESSAPVQLVHSPEAVEYWHRFSRKPCYCFHSPFVFYRRSRGIAKAVEAAGTIAFPAHTTPSIEDVSDIGVYIDQLLAMPKEFQPVSVCLHMHDVNKGRYKPFLERNIPVFTAGDVSDYRFTERFYGILRKFAYATSNVVGSYAYYAVEMGIPFSIYGNSQEYINAGDPNISIGAYDPSKESKTYQRAYDLFHGLFTSITPEQKKMVETELGIRHGISRWKMAQALYVSFLKLLFSRTGYKHAASCVSRIVNRFIVAE